MAAPTDALVQVEVADTDGQHVEYDRLDAPPGTRTAGEDALGTRLWLPQAREIDLTYHARVTVTRAVTPIEGLAMTPRHALPADVVHHLFPSRYCPSMAFEDSVAADYGHLSGGAAAAAMRDWIMRHFVYRPEATGPAITALETIAARAGVCRDYAHALVTLTRAAGIPARVASGYAPRVTPLDFHLVAELYLDGGWHIVDPTGMAAADDFAVIGVGRDAADVAFLTTFGHADFIAQSVDVHRTDG